MRPNINLKGKVIPASILFLSLLTIEADSQTFQTAESYKKDIDIHMENLEMSLRSLDYQKACEEASNASLLISRHLNSLRLIEPNYSWVSIKELLLTIPQKYCLK